MYAVLSSNSLGPLGVSLFPDAASIHQTPQGWSQSQKGSHVAHDDTNCNAVI